MKSSGSMLRLGLKGHLSGVGRYKPILYPINHAWWYEGIATQIISHQRHGKFMDPPSVRVR
jgi:hypothetical protein